MNLLFLTPGVGEIGLIIVVTFLLFGGEQTPKIAKSLGKAFKEFKKIMNELRNGDDRD